MIVNFNAAQDLLFAEDPRPLEMVKPCEFPMHVLPGALRNYCYDVSENLLMKPDMVAGAMLGLIGAASQGRYSIEPKSNWRLPVNLYVAIVASTGQKKSKVLRMLRSPIDDVIDAINAANKEKMESNENERRDLILRISAIENGIARGTKKYSGMKDELRQLRSQIASTPEILPLRLFFEDCTTEKIADLLLKHNERLCNISDEGTLFSILLGRYSDGINIDLPLKAFTGERLYVDRISRESIELKNPLLTFIQFVQPLKLKEFFSCREMVERGMTARFLYITNTLVEEDEKLDTPLISLENERGYKLLMNNIVRRSLESDYAVLKLSDEAYEMFSVFFASSKRSANEELSPMADWAVRIPEHCLRITALLHIAQDSGGTAIEAETMAKAIELTDYFTRHAMQAYGLTTNKAEYLDAKYMLDKVKERKISRIGQGDAKKIFAKFRHNVAGLNRALTVLCEHGYAKTVDVKSGKAGRKGQRDYMFHPDILKGKYVVDVAD
jgi:Arc/MetJ family transcription regulator